MWVMTKKSHCIIELLNTQACAPGIIEFCAKKEAKVVGSVKVANSPIHEPQLRTEFPNTPTIYQLYVAPAVRREGIASQLMDSAEAMLREKGNGSVLLCVALDNTVAVSLYRRRGYSPCHRVVKSVWVIEQRGESSTVEVDVLPMIKSLDSANININNAVV